MPPLSLPRNDSSRIVNDLIKRVERLERQIGSGNDNADGNGDQSLLSYARLVSFDPGGTYPRSDGAPIESDWTLSGAQINMRGFTLDGANKLTVSESGIYWVRATPGILFSSGGSHMYPNISDANGTIIVLGPSMAAVASGQQAQAAFGDVLELVAGQHVGLIIEGVGATWQGTWELFIKQLPGGGRYSLGTNAA